MAKADSKVSEIMELVKGMTVLELSELVKALEEEFGVTAAAPMAAAVPVAAAVEEEEKDEFDVILTSSGEKKIQVIKAVREITSLGLKEAKDLVDNIPGTIQEKISKEEAEATKAKIEEAGGVVELN